MKFLYKYVFDKQLNAYKIYNTQTDSIHSYAHTIAEAIEIVNTLNRQYNRNGRNPLNKI